MPSRSMLHMLRRRERHLLDSQCNITRGEHPNVTAIHTARACNIVPHQRATREVESAGQTVALNLYQVTVEADTNIERMDVVTVTASHDPTMVGRWLVVLEVPPDDWVTMRRVIAHEGIPGG